MLKWKLIHEHDRLYIQNDNGKKLGYNPNSGIKIMDVDGYAFKDLNGNGQLEAMEDWRQPLKERVENFKKQYRIVQIDNTIYYKKGTLKFSQDVSLNLEELHAKNQATLQQLLIDGNMSEEYLRDNYILVIMIMMFDSDDIAYLQDYTIQTFIQGIEQGVLDNLLYSLSKAIQKYMQEHFHKPCIQL